MSDRRRSRPFDFSAAAPFLWIGAICIGVELLLSLADLANRPLRLQAVQLLGFWPTRLYDGGLSATAMFVTYWVVHSGPTHLFGNLAILVWTAPRLVPHLSPGSLWNIWIAAVLGGGLFYTVLPRDGLVPMIGASGGIFGLIGALLVVRYRRAHRSRQTAAALGNLALACVGLVGLSAIDFVLRGSFVAWQAHLGGLVVGAVLTAIEPQRWR